MQQVSHCQSLKRQYELDKGSLLVVVVLVLVVVPKYFELHVEYLGLILENLVELVNFENLDLENLIGELTDLGSEKKNAVVSLLEQVTQHLLLLEYWTAEREQNQAHWESEIISFRTQLRRRLTTNLRNHLIKELRSIYQDTLIYLRTKTRFKVNFPEFCPYSLDQLLDINYLLDSDN